MRIDKLIKTSFSITMSSTTKYKWKLKMVRACRQELRTRLLTSEELDTMAQYGVTIN